MNSCRREDDATNTHQNSASIISEILIASSLSLATLIFLFIFYDGRHILHWPPSLKQIAVGLIPQIIVIITWRRYIYNMLHQERRDPHEEEKEESVFFLRLHLVPYWYLSCIAVAFANCLLPIQILFADNQLHPDTGEPYSFGIFCAICHAFMDVLLGLNILLDAFIFVMKKIAKLANFNQLNVFMLKVGRRTRQFRAPVTFLLSAKIVLGGALIANEDPIVVKITVPIRHHLPESLDNFRIIQMSDVHVGVSVGRTRVERMVYIVNELCSSKNEKKCDLLALTGDFVDGDPYHLMKAIDPLENLVPGDKSTAKIFVTGNHERIHDNVEHVIEVLSDMGIDSLVNANVRLPKGKPRNEQLVVVGLDDYSSRKSSGKEQDEAFDGIEPGRDTIILLAHQPNHIKVANQHGVHLMLSGHTHAGQFFPGTLGAWLLNAKYSGYYPSSEKRPAVYVSAGTHWWGPPVRFTTRHHEIADIRLVRSE